MRRWEKEKEKKREGKGSPKTTIEVERSLHGADSPFKRVVGGACYSKMKEARLEVGDRESGNYGWG